jgi:hypothetical protein
MRSSGPIIVFFIIVAVVAGLALRSGSLGGAGDITQLVQPTHWTAPALITSTSQPIEATGWWDQLPTKKPVGKQPTPTKTPKP